SESQPESDAPAAERLAFDRVEHVRQTVIAIIRDHLRPDSRTSWQGCDFDFRGIRFEGGDFTGAVFSGGNVYSNTAEFRSVISFHSAIFSGSKVDFNGARFAGLVLFNDAEFLSGAVSFYGAIFSDGAVWFDGAVFSGSKVVSMTRSSSVE